MLEDPWAAPDPKMFVLTADPEEHPTDLRFEIDLSGASGGGQRPAAQPANLLYKLNELGENKARGLTSWKIGSWE